MAKQWLYFPYHHNEDTDKLLCCQTADLTADLNLYFVLKGHVPASLFALADHVDLQRYLFYGKYRKCHCVSQEYKAVSQQNFS